MNENLKQTEVGGEVERLTHGPQSRVCRVRRLHVDKVRGTRSRDFVQKDWTPLCVEASEGTIECLRRIPSLSQTRRALGDQAHSSADHQRARLRIRRCMCEATSASRVPVSSSEISSLAIARSSTDIWMWRGGLCLRYTCRVHSHTVSAIPSLTAKPGTGPFYTS